MFSGLMEIKINSTYHNLPPELLMRIHPIKIPDNTLNPIMVGTMLRVITGKTDCNLFRSWDSRLS